MASRINILNYLHEQLSLEPSRGGQKALRKQFFRACVETILERSMVPGLEPPRKQRPNVRSFDEIMSDERDTNAAVIVRFLPFWRGLGDDDLWSLFDALAVYFNHHTVRRTEL